MSWSVPTLCAIFYLFRCRLVRFIAQNHSRCERLSKWGPALDFFSGFFDYRRYGLSHYNVLLFKTWVAGLFSFRCRRSRFFVRVLWLVVRAIQLPVVALLSLWFFLDGLVFVVVIRCKTSFVFLAAGPREFVLSVRSLVTIVGSLYLSTLCRSLTFVY